MILILLSLLSSFLCGYIGWMIFNNEAIFIYGGIVGFLIPSLVILEKLYKNTKSK